MTLPGLLVDAEWLAAHARDEGLVVADVRWYPDGSGRRRYEEGHIPGALFVDVDRDLAAPRGPRTGRHPLPAPEEFAEHMSALGIGDRTAVVAYDDAGGAYAARLWWMLDVTGHRAAVLDGGLAAWRGSVETGTRSLEPAEFTPAPWPADPVVDADDVERLRHDPRTVVLDARAVERYRGEVEPIDAKAGHIPGARSLPFSENLDPVTGAFLPPEELRRRFERIGARQADQVLVYCGSGVTSCHHLLAMRLAGLEKGRLYTGSWSEWSSQDERPVAVGEER